MRCLPGLPDHPSGQSPLCHDSYIRKLEQIFRRIPDRAKRVEINECISLLVVCRYMEMVIR